MKRFSVDARDEQIFARLFQEEKAAVFEKLDQLEQALYHLQYEGKVSSSRHIKKADDVMRFLKKTYTAHVDLDERVIFPFLEKHIPRLQSVLLYLRAERREFEDGITVFEKILQDLKKGNNGVIRHRIIDRLKDKGIYLICQMRSHIQLEEQSVYNSIQRELQAGEKNALIHNITHYSFTHCC